MNFGVALGYKVADHVRAELAINRFQNFPPETFLGVPAIHGDCGDGHGSDGCRFF